MKCLRCRREVLENREDMGLVNSNSIFKWLNNPLAVLRTSLEQQTLKVIRLSRARSNCPWTGRLSPWSSLPRFIVRLKRTHLLLEKSGVIPVWVPVN